MEIKKVLIRKDGIKYIIIPKQSSINAGDLVVISNNLNLVNKFKTEESNVKGRKD